MRTPENVWSAPATADYSATLYRFVTLASTGKFTLTGTSAQADGVMGNAPVADAQARVNWGGVQKIEAGTGGLALGDKVYSDTNGKGVAGVATVGAYYMGRCVKAAAAGEVAEMLWSPGSNAG
jgi:hypothetical protein